MKNAPNPHRRRSIRLKGYDYSRNGYYFVTICTENHWCLFGEIEQGNMVLNTAGMLIEKEWGNIACRFHSVRLHEFIVMPNHFHGIIELRYPTLAEHAVPGQFKGESLPIIGDGGESCQREIMKAAPRVGDIVGAFKSLTTNKYARQTSQNNWPRFDKRLWQRNYYEHVIRDRESYLKIAEYIQTNPLKWHDDQYYVPKK